MSLDGDPIYNSVVENLRTNSKSRHSFGTKCGQTSYLLVPAWNIYEDLIIINQCHGDILLIKLYCTNMGFLISIVQSYSTVAIQNIGLLLPYIP